jgi:hypothetical protein
MSSHCVQNRCPTCGTPAHVRVGIRLPARKAAIFDAIKAAGEIGVSSRELVTAVYCGGEARRQSVIKSHVWQINSVLEETDFRIVSDGKRWLLTKRRV